MIYQRRKDGVLESAEDLVGRLTHKAQRADLEIVAQVEVDHPVLASDLQDSDSSLMLK
jgi:hypothetical protein